MPPPLRERWLGTPIWKEILIALLTAVAAILVLLLHRLVARDWTNSKVNAAALKMLTPVALLLGVLVLEPFFADEIDAAGEFAELVERGERAGVQVGFAVSPGLSIRYSSADDLDALQRKLAGFREIGARFLTLALDDTTSELEDPGDRAAFASLAHAHIHAAETAREALPDVSEKGERVALLPEDSPSGDAGSWGTGAGSPGEAD